MGGVRANTGLTVRPAVLRVLVHPRARAISSGVHEAILTGVDPYGRATPSDDNCRNSRDQDKEDKDEQPPHVGLQTRRPLER